MNAPLQTNAEAAMSELRLASVFTYLASTRSECVWGQELSRTNALLTLTLRVQGFGCLRVLEQLLRLPECLWQLQGRGQSVGTILGQLQQILWPSDQRVHQLPQQLAGVYDKLHEPPCALDQRC